MEEGAVQPVPRPGGGLGIGIIYKDAQKDYDHVRWATNEASAKALHTIQAEINTRAAGEVPVLVFNPLAWQRYGPDDRRCRDAFCSGQRRVGSRCAEAWCPRKCFRATARPTPYHLLLRGEGCPVARAIRCYTWSRASAPFRAT